MKKILMAGAVAFCLVGITNESKAQLGNVTVTVNVLDVISVTATVPAVVFNLSGSASYATNQTQTVTANLLVTSTRDWDLDVKSQTANFSFLTNNIPVNLLQVQVVSNHGGTNTGSVNMSTTNQKLLDEATASLAGVVDVKYTLQTNTNASSFNVPAGAYIATLVYTGTID